MQSKKQKNVKNKNNNKKIRAEKRVRPRREKGTILNSERDQRLKGNLAKARMVAQMEGQRGVDPRASGLSPPDALGNLALAQLDHSVDVVGFAPSQVFAVLALGPVLSAIKRGWLSSRTIAGATGPQVAYNAWVYLTQSFLQASQGTFPTLQSAPEWFWQICDAVRPKVVPFKTADVSYKMSLLGDGVTYVPSSVFEYLSPYNLVFGNPDTATLVNGMPTLAPVAYSADLALASIQSLFDYFPESLMCKRSGQSTVPYMVKDASAFAGVYSEWGFDGNGLGGVAISLTNESKIHSPIIAKLCQYGDTRGYIEERRGSGSACYVIPRMMEMTEYKQMHNKAPPIFKYFNFDRYFDILALALGRALAIATTSGVGFAPGPVPLTPQQVQILLRQAILPIFCNEMAQDVASGDGFIQFPFCTASNGYATPGSGMLLPSFLAEAIRTAGRKTLSVSADFPDYQLDYVPILCRSPQIFQLGNYEFAPGSLVFTDDINETPIDLIDMSATIPVSGKVYILPTCAEVDENMETWNQWMKQMESAFAGLTAIGTEKGISCLSSVFFSDYMTPSSLGNGPAPPQGRGGPATTKKQESKKNVKEFGTTKKGKLKTVPVPAPGGIDTYTTIGIVSTSTCIAENGPEWKYQRVIPHAYNQAAFGGDGDWFVSKRQVFNHEGFKINHSTQGIDNSGNPGDVALWSQSVYNIDLAASAFCVRGQLAAESEVERDLRVMGEQGRGGFLSAIAGFLGEDIFGVKGAKKFASQVGELTGL